jgi:U8 snoRNA-decapping enzyme
MSEITGIKIVPLIHHENKGIKRFLENSFAGATREDLDVLLCEVFDMKI